MIKERNTKMGLDYFPLHIDIFEDEKILAAQEIVEPHNETNRFMLPYVTIRLLRDIYNNGYFLPWDSLTALRFVNNMGFVKKTYVESVINCLLETGFFNKQLFEKYSILTSRGIQKRWLIAMRNSNRKVREIKKEYKLYFSTPKVEKIILPKISLILPKISLILPKISLILPQDNKVLSYINNTGKGVYSKEYVITLYTLNSKTNINKEREIPYPPQDNAYPPQDNAYPPQDNAYPPQDNAYPHEDKENNKEKQPTIRQLCVEEWFKFYEEKFKNKPLFKDTDGKHLNSLLKILKERSEKKGFDWTTQKSVETLRAFLTRAWDKDDWIKNNFSLANLYSQFNAIANGSAGNKTGQPTKGHQPIDTARADAYFDKMFSGDR